jgi:hypothetical protein
MDHEKLVKLEKDIKAIEQMNQDSKTSNQELTYFKDKLITDYDLQSYDGGIKMEMHNTNFFIFDVQRIIADLYKKKSTE